MAMPVIRTLGKNLVREGLSGKSKRKAGLLCARNYGVARGASPDLKYSFGTSRKTGENQAREPLTACWLFSRPASGEGRRSGAKWDRHKCLSQRMPYLIGPSILTASFRFGDAASSGAESAALLEALAAKDRASLCGPEGDSGFLTALGAGGLCFRAHL
jgi:hypothetical protein